MGLNREEEVATKGDIIALKGDIDAFKGRYEPAFEFPVVVNRHRSGGDKHLIIDTHDRAVAVIGEVGGAVNRRRRLFEGILGFWRSIPPALAAIAKVWHYTSVNINRALPPTIAKYNAKPKR